jgi:hypothetical protein
MLACTGHSVSRQNLRWRCATTLAAPMRPRSSICPSRISSNGSSWQAARPRLSLRRVMDPAFRRRPSTPLPIDAFSPLSPSWRSRYHVAVHDHAVETAPAGPRLIPMLSTSQVTYSGHLTSRNRERRQKDTGAGQVVHGALFSFGAVHCAPQTRSRTGAFFTSVSADFTAIARLLTLSVDSGRCDSGR